MTSALIGCTGFVGSNLLRQHSFDKQYNSRNIAEIDGHDFQLIVCAGVSATKWLANQQPEADWRNIQSLMAHLQTVRCDQFVLISTIDVYAAPQGVDENTVIDASQLEPYGKHRFLFEEFVREKFPAHLVMRLPGLFGAGLKKNVIFDLLHTGKSEWTHRDSVFQFYSLDHLWHDLGIALNSGESLVNIAPEPVSTLDVARTGFGLEFDNITEKPPVRYDMHTRHASLYDMTAPYLYRADQVLAEIAAFVQHHRIAS